MQSFLEKVLSSLVIAAFIPALMFILTASIVFYPLAPTGLTKDFKDLFGQPSLIFLLLTVILGFTLLNLGNLISRFYRGYALLERLPFSCFFEKRRAKRLREKIKKTQDEIQRLESMDVAGDVLEALKDQHYNCCRYLEETFPPEGKTVLPTQYGNTLRAAETYSAVRYGLDAVLIWPRLLHVIPSNHYERIDETHHQLAFFINCSFLSLVFAALCLFSSGFQYAIYRLAAMGQSSPVYFISIDLSSKVYQQRAILYLVVFIAALFSFWLFYRMSISLAQQYGNMYRGAFDLFRFELLKQLRQPLPQDSEDEWDTWRKISEFMMYGDRYGPLFFEYLEYTETDST
jgi:hypothetical protein